METTRTGGYSAKVESYLVVGQGRYRIAKTNSRVVTLSEDCEIPPGAIGYMEITIDGDTALRHISLPQGVTLGQRSVTFLFESQT